MKKLISIFISIAIIASISCLSVFAHNVEGKYKEYTVIGDSIAAGYGLDKRANGDTDISHWERVEDSYYDIVTDEIGCDLNIHARDGFTTLTEMVLLDPSFRDSMSAEDQYVVSSIFANHGEMTDEELAAKQLTAAQEVKDSDLVTVNLGSNDILTSSLYRMAYLTSTAEDTAPVISEFKEMLSEYGSLGSTMSTIIGLGETLSALDIAMIKSFMSFVENYNVLMNTIHELNPGATVLALGLFNPIKGTKLGDIEINNAVLSSTLVQMANMYIQYLCPARQYYEYVDVYDTEVYMLRLSTDEDGNLISDPDYEADGAVWHPTRTGHAQMAEDILNVLDEINVTTGSADPCSSLKDIDKGAWYHDAVDYVLEKGIMTGTSSTTFDPQANLTRAQFVQILYAAAGKPSVSSAADYSDIEAGRYYVNAVNWADSIGIISGYSDGTFRPSNNVTREEMAVILRAYSGYKLGAAKYISDSYNKTSSISVFNDASSVSKWAEDSVTWATANGLISGYEDNTIRPQEKTTRAEAAQIMKAFYEL